MLSQVVLNYITEGDETELQVYGKMRVAEAKALETHTSKANTDDTWSRRARAAQWKFGGVEIRNAQLMEEIGIEEGATINVSLPATLDDIPAPTERAAPPPEAGGSALSRILTRKALFATV